MVYLWFKLLTILQTYRHTHQRRGFYGN